MISHKSILQHICLIITIAGTGLLTLNCQNNANASVHIQRHSVDTNKVVIDTDRFTVTQPDGWRHLTKERVGFKILDLISPPQEGFTPNVNILTEDMHGKSAVEYIQTSDELMAVLNVVIDGSGDFNCNGTAGKYSTSTFNNQGQIIAVKTYFFFKDGLAYVITGSCLVTQTTEFRPIFDQIVKTFKIR